MYAQSCPTLCEPRDCNPPGSIVHRIFQAKILEWVAISSSRGSSWPRGRTGLSCISCIVRQILYYWHHLRSPFLVHFYSVVNMIHQLNKFHLNTYSLVRFPGGSDGKDSACNAGNQSSMLRLGGFPGEEKGILLQYSFLENSMNRGAWWATVHVVAKSQTWLID